jgi:transcriptional regulator with XRE-family HTH domain
VTFGEELRQHRAARGWSLRRCAGLMYLSPGYLSKLENDKSAPTAMAAKAADAAFQTGTRFQRYVIDSTRDPWTTIDKLVGTEGAPLAGYERVQAVKQEQARRSRETELVGVFAMADGSGHDDTEPLQVPRSSLLPSSDAVVAASQQAWRAVRSHLIRHRTQLAEQAARLYDPAWRLTHTPALALPSWLPSGPVPIEAVTLEWVPQPPRPVITGREPELRPVLVSIQPRS